MTKAGIMEELDIYFYREEKRQVFEGTDLNTITVCEYELKIVASIVLRGAAQKDGVFSYKAYIIKIIALATACKDCM